MIYLDLFRGNMGQVTRRVNQKFIADTINIPDGWAARCRPWIPLPL